jgi:hypothetical protein
MRGPAAHCSWLVRGDGDPGGAVGHHGQPGAVERAGAGGAELVGLAGLGFGVADDLPGSACGEGPGACLLTGRVSCAAGTWVPLAV